MILSPPWVCAGHLHEGCPSRGTLADRGRWSNGRKIRSPSCRIGETRGVILSLVLSGAEAGAQRDAGFGLRGLDQSQLDPEEARGFELEDAVDTHVLEAPRQ